MSRSIRFKLRGEEEVLALAFERHCREVLDITAPLDDLVKRQFLKFLMDNLDTSPSQSETTLVDNIDKSETDSTTQGDGSDVANTGGNPAGDTDAPGASPAGTGQGITQGDPDPGAVPTGD